MVGNIDSIAQRSKGPNANTLPSKRGDALSNLQLLDCLERLQTATRRSDNHRRTLQLPVVPKNPPSRGVEPPPTTIPGVQTNLPREHQQTPAQITAEPAQPMYRPTLATCPSLVRVSLTAYPLRSIGTFTGLSTSRLAPCTNPYQVGFGRALAYPFRSLGRSMGTAHRANIRLCPLRRPALSTAIYYT